MTNKDKIYPWIKVVYEPEEDVPNSTQVIELSEEDSPVRKTWLGNLDVFYVIDEGDSFNIILNRDMSTDLTLEQLHEIAITNLDRDVEFCFNETVFGGYGLVARGDHEAGSLCLDGIWHWCADQLNDNLVVAVPAKDMIMMVPVSDNEKIIKLKEFVTEFFKDGERLLTKQLYLFDREQNTWTIWGQTE